MINVVKNYNLKVNFSKGIFSSNEKIIFVENDNKSVKFNFEFEEVLNEQIALLKIKHYLGDVIEKTISIVNQKAEFIFTNDILKAGNLKMSISLIGTNNEILTSTEYLDNIVIKETLGEGEDPSEKEISSLLLLISEVNNIKSDIKTAKENGDFNGISAYEEAVKLGFLGTEEEWLASLKADFEEEKLNEKYERKHTHYKVTLTEEVESMAEYELPFSYIVGNKDFEIYYNNEYLIREQQEDDEANYREVGEVGSTSNKIIFGWNLRVGDVLDFVVKGVVENEESEN